MNEFELGKKMVLLIEQRLKGKEVDASGILEMYLTLIRKTKSLLQSTEWKINR